jgi:hypothetical protein
MAMLRIVVGLVLAAHAIGHSIGLVQILRWATINPQWNGDSWLLTGTIGSAVTQAVGVIVWSIALVGFVATAGSVVGWLPEIWWPPLAIVSAAASLAGLLLFPVAFPLTSSIGALVIDVVVLGAVVWASWTPSDLAA